MPQPTLIVNGRAVGFADVKFIIAGTVLIGLTKISYSRKQNKENLYGSGYEPVGRGRGNIEYEASVEMYIEEWRRIIAASPNGNPMDIPPFNIPVVYGVINPTKDILLAAEFMEDNIDSSQGDTNIKVTVPLIIAGIQKG